MGIDKGKSLSTTAAGMRLKTEERLHVKTAELHPHRIVEEAQMLGHEPDVSRIELETQNAELRRAQAELELSRNNEVVYYEG